MRKSVFAGLLLAINSAAWGFGSDERWTSGYGQGVAEAIVTKGPGNRIITTCDVGADRNATGISFLLGGREPTGNSIVLTFDNEDPQRFSLFKGKIISNCRVCADIYQVVVEKLKKHTSVHVLFENGDAARFTLRGASKAIGKCTSDFAR